jgi:hypothetical protein
MLLASSQLLRHLLHFQAENTKWGIQKATILLWVAAG